MSDRPPNIVFILCDDLGSTTFVAMGGRITTRPISTVLRKRGCGLRPPMPARPFVYHPGESRNTVPSDEEGGKAEYELTREAIRFMQENADHPFVAYLGHYTPHIPYTAKKHLVEKNSDAFEPVYAALIETLDDTVGLLLEEIESLGLADDTIVIFTSDNGGLHVPEGGHARVTHNTPYRAGKGYTYEGGQRVPLIVRWPGHIEAGAVVDAPVNNVDWIPTLLELAGSALPDTIDGRSFADGLLHGRFEERDIFWHFPHYTNQGGGGPAAPCAPETGSWSNSTMRTAWSSTTSPAISASAAIWPGHTRMWWRVCAPRWTSGGRRTTRR